MTTGKSLEILTGHNFDSWRDSVTLCIVAKKRKSPNCPPGVSYVYTGRILITRTIPNTEGMPSWTVSRPSAT
jgi:hypothetical protein